MTIETNGPSPTPLRETERRGSSGAPRLIAFYLPQYHSIPENDEWWGKGFTEWTNVTRARSLFPGHDQPHLPADLGFYDLRVREVCLEQAVLAREYGIHGFCYYHYWFSGRRLLGRPFDEVLMSGEPDFPFCLCWANEPWSRHWDGGDHEMLMPQAHSHEDDLTHIRWLARAFRDPRYIRVEGRPLFLVYRLSLMPDPVTTSALWRGECDRLGVGDPYLCRVNTYSENPEANPLVQGFDAAVEFVPHSVPHSRYFGERRWPRLGRWPFRRRPRREEVPIMANHIYSYEDTMRRALSQPEPSHEWFRCTMPSWDNSARRTAGQAYIFTGSTPELYGAWLAGLVGQTMAKTPGRRLVFINAWNEWGEGNHLEPCQRWGTAYLEATRRVSESKAISALEESRFAQDV